MTDPQHSELILGDIADIFMGATVSVYSKSPIHGEPIVHLITGSTLDNCGNIDKNSLVPVWKHKHNTNHFIAQSKDILVLARGNIRAAVIDQNLAKEKILASANFAIIRPTSPACNSTYIAELFNSPKSRERLGLVFGSRVPSLRAADLRRLKIPTLNLDQHNAINELSSARHEAYNATLALAEQQFRVASNVLDQIIWDAK